MTVFLRIIQQARWAQNPDIGWLLPGELQGDALKDLQTIKGKLSVFAVENGITHQDIIIALAATREDIDVLDYAVFEDDSFAMLGMETIQEDGNTPVSEVNKVHYHIINLTTEHLVHLATIVSSGEKRRVFGKDIGIFLHQAMREGRLNTAVMKSKLRDRLTDSR